MISYSDLRRGMVLELDGEPWEVVEYQHTKMQQQAPTLTLKVRHLKTGRVLERKLPGNRPLTVAPVDHRPSQYLYNDGEFWYFMDEQTYEQYPLSREQLGDYVSFLKEGMSLTVVFYKDSPLTVEMPITVELEVVDTPPGVKGDTAQGGTKPATLETGLVVQVPLFVNAGERVKVDTRSGQYLERA